MTIDLAFFGPPFFCLPLLRFKPFLVPLRVFRPSIHSRYNDDDHSPEPASQTVVPFARPVRGCGRRRCQRSHSETMTATRRWRLYWEWPEDSPGDHSRHSLLHLSQPQTPTKLTTFFSKSLFLSHLFSKQDLVRVFGCTQANTKDSLFHQLYLVPFGIASKLRLSHCCSQSC